ncbi:nicotianamine aminotransferase B-like isoform X2 [Cynara cardunculus var. scolymus]|uniref:nicotianamine aminotransferase B-like isoform X2 n=1 Tax=Cynara cardunculus var. scolymus TaxID=59895 RepID=UPI000D627A53|nr:nicotianamine aminotransferase B-like isoform X2 [Cynara cardunculus var. scolymus]
MENGSTLKKKWGFQPNPELNTASEITIRGVLEMLISNLNQSDVRHVIPLGHGDPSAFPCFRTTQIAEDAIVDAVRSAKFNGYSPTVGVLPARRAVAEYLSQRLPNKLSPDDVFLTVGCIQAIQTIITVLANSKANILLPRPGFPYYEAVAQSCHLEARHFDLLPDKDWEVDLDAVEALADENTVAMVIINPGNPCGNVFTYQHLQKIIECITGYLNISCDPPTFIQGAVSDILGKTQDDFFAKIVNLIKEDANTCYEGIKDIPGIICPSKPAGSMFVMVKLDLSAFEDIEDDLEFCVKLVKEESLIILPGVVVGLKNWIRITYAIEPSYLQDGIKRLKAFCERHSKKA